MTIFLLYNSSFYFNLNYCSHIWGNTFITKYNTINILQKRALKCICLSSSRPHLWNNLTTSLKIIILYMHLVLIIKRF